MTSVSVSIAMATYNGQRHIQRQLDSLAAQSRIPAELVVCDDASVDGTVAVIDAFSKTAAFPVHIYRNETRLGYRANFMRAANLCRSELIAFCDQDDYWYPQKILRSIEPFSDREVLLSYHNADVVTDDGRQIGSLAVRTSQNSILPPLAAKPWMTALGFTEVFRQSLLKFSNLWPTSQGQHDSSQPCGHDQWFFFLAATLGKIVYLGEPLVAYVQHGTNTFGWFKDDFWRGSKYFFNNRANGSYKYSRVAENRAIILRSASNELEGEWRERAILGASYYSRLSSLHSLRHSLYTSNNLTDRVKALGAVLSLSGYTGTWSLGRRSFIADLCLGVPVGPLLPRMAW